MYVIYIDDILFLINYNVNCNGNIGHYCWSSNLGWYYYVDFWSKIVFVGILLWLYKKVNILNIFFIYCRQGRGQEGSNLILLMNKCNKGWDQKILQCQMYKKVYIVLGKGLKVYLSYIDNCIKKLTYFTFQFSLEPF